MLDRVGIPVSDYARSKDFYLRTFAPLGYAALKAGAKDNGPPGLRPHYHANYYGAFVLDPDGHNVEAVCHLPE